MLIATTSYNYGAEILENMHKAANCFERETEFLANARPYISWDSPWGVDEKRSKKLAPILMEASDSYEKGIEYLEKALTYFN